MTCVVVNGRVMASEVTGLQRYLSELSSRFPSHVAIAPEGGAGVIAGHLWEQAILPLRLKRSDMLFSPANSGPLCVRRQVVTIHDVVTLDRPEWFGNAKAALYRAITPRLARRVARVITISEYSKQRLLAHVPMDERRIVVIPNGVDARFCPQDASTVDRMRATLRLPGGRYVLSVGTLEPRKNVPRLLQAWSQVVGSLPDDIGLVLTGKQDQAELFARVSGLDALPPRVHLTGHVSDALLPALYAGATALAFPSLYEGFGLPPLEAMASGVPVLSGNLTSLPEVVGDAGVMVDPTDVEAIADGLRRLLLDEGLRQSMIPKGLARAAQFSWDLTAQRTWEVLQEAAET